MVAIILCTLCIPTFGQRAISHVSRLRDGDLLFLVTKTPNAITTVTKGQHSQAIDHVGIFHFDEGRAMVLEATYDGVVETPLSDFGTEASKVLVGRIRSKFDIRKSLSNAHAFIGRPYDFLYLPDNPEIYCSELVLLSFVDEDGRNIFTPIPMTFRDSNGDLPPYWQEFYSRRLTPVPEGVSGSNPGELSRRQNVRIKYEWRGIAK